MLLQLLTQHPEAIFPVVRNTPAWVWGLLTALLALGISQLRDRTASLLRVSLLPVAMGIFSATGTLAALGNSPHLGTVVAAWLAAAGVALALVAPGASNAQFDPLRRLYQLPGSVVPLLLIGGLFLVKYVVGVDLAMAPQLASNVEYALAVATIYGAFSGVFAGRAWRLWRLALRPTVAAAA